MIREKCRDNWDILYMNVYREIIVKNDPCDFYLAIWLYMRV